MALRPSGKFLSIELWILLRCRLRLVGGVVGLGLRTRLGGGVVGSVLVATPWPGSVHSTCIELQRLRLRLRLRLGGAVVGSVRVATPGSVHGTFFELQLLIMPQHHIHIPPRPLLFWRYKPTKK